MISQSHCSLAFFAVLWFVTLCVTARYSSCQVREGNGPTPRPNPLWQVWRRSDVNTVCVCVSVPKGELILCTIRWALTIIDHFHRLTYVSVCVISKSISLHCFFTLSVPTILPFHFFYSINCIFFLLSSCIQCLNNNTPPNQLILHTKNILNAMKQFH